MCASCLLVELYEKWFRYDLQVDTLMIIIIMRMTIERSEKYVYSLQKKWKKNKKWEQIRVGESHLHEHLIDWWSAVDLLFKSHLFKRTSELFV